MAKELKYLYPSQFGSHKSMVNQEKTDELRRNGDTQRVVCVDQYGPYVTEVEKLDNKEIDWNRANGERVKIEKEKKK